MRISIAIDGPAGAGKSTIAKLISKKYNLMYINTGAMYRAVTLKAMENNIKYTDVSNLLKLIDSLNMYFENDRLILNGNDVTEELYSPNISENVSNYAAVKEVRKKMVSLQRKMSKKYDVIMDGRDIGTVVLKDANLKFFLNATPETRAHRRYAEFLKKGIDIKYSEILEQIKKRDYIDSHRKINPLTKANDAIEIDTSSLTIPQVVNIISSYINKLKNINLN